MGWNQNFIQDLRVKPCATPNFMVYCVSLKGYLGAVWKVTCAHAWKSDEEKIEPLQEHWYSNSALWMTLTPPSRVVSNHTQHGTAMEFDGI